MVHRTRELFRKPYRCVSLVFTRYLLYLSMSSISYCANSKWVWQPIVVQRRSLLLLVVLKPTWLFEGTVSWTVGVNVFACSTFFWWRQGSVVDHNYSFSSWIIFNYCFIFILNLLHLIMVLDYTELYCMTPIKFRLKILNQKFHPTFMINKCIRKLIYYYNLLFW